MTLNQTDPPQQLQPKYAHSSQYQCWRFSPTELSQLRSTANEAAKQRVWKSHQLEFELTHKTKKSIQEIQKEVDCLSPDEELLLIQHFQSQIPKLCKAFKLNELVKATAITYFKRFFLHNSVMEYDPKIIMLTCTFLACKSTHHPLTVSEFTAKIPKVSDKQITDTEFTVCEELNFQFWVRDVGSALWGLFLEIQSIEPPNQDDQIDTNLLYKIYQSSITIASTILLGDLIFIYQPSQIALACFKLSSDSEEFKFDLTSYLRHKYTDRIKDYEVLMNWVDDIITEIRRERDTPFDAERCKDIDLKLQKCKNLEKIEGSKTYEYKQRQDQEKQESKRKAKLAAMKAKMDNEDGHQNNQSSNSTSTSAFG